MYRLLSLFVSMASLCFCATTQAQTNTTSTTSSTNESSPVNDASSISDRDEPSPQQPLDGVPSFAPPWPEPPVIVPMYAEIKDAAAARRAQLPAETAVEITPGVDSTDAVNLPVNSVVSARFSDSQKQHVYLLQPLEDTNQLTELLIWTEDPKRLRVELKDSVNGNEGRLLMGRSAVAPITRLLIQKPTLLYLSQRKGDKEYRLAWRTTEELEPGFEYEPNSIRAIATDVVERLPRMEKQNDNEYALSGYIDAQDKVDYFVLETDQAGIVTMEASSGLLGFFIGSHDSRSTKVDKRPVLTDILVLPGKNVFYIRGAKGDYSIRAALSPLADRYQELEPNGTVPLAHRLPIGQQRTGRLPVAKDDDYYFFNWPTTGSVRLSARAGDGGDLSLRLYRNAVEVVKLSAATTISEVVELNAGTYEVRVSTKKPSLEPYAISVSAVNPLAGDAANAASSTAPEAASGATSEAAPDSTLSLNIVADVSTVKPFSDKGQVLSGVARIANNSDADIAGTVMAASSHDRIRVDIPEAFVTVAANSEADVPFQVRVGRLTHAFGDVPLFFSITHDGGAASTEWDISFPYDAPPTPMVWFDQPLPAEFMGAFDVARTNFGGVVHREVTCNCTPRLAKSKTVFGSDQYELRSSLCGSAVHAGEIGLEGGVIRVITGSDPVQFIASQRNGIKSREGKPGASSFSFYPVDGHDKAEIANCEKSLTKDPQGRANLFTGLPFRTHFKGESVAVNLAGERAVDVSGVMLSLRGTGKNPVREFAIDVSDDGFEFNNVFTGELQLTDELQPFVFESPVPARFVRARLLSGFSDVHPRELSLGALKVMASKEKPIPMHAGINLAVPAMGAHVFSRRKGDSVLGFHHSRLALIDEITIESKDKREEFSVAVQISDYGPYGPWTVLSNEQIKPLSSVTLSLDEPMKAKYLRLSGSWSQAGAVFASRVREVGSSATYQSIVAEWGNEESDAYFELGVDPAPNVASSRIESMVDRPFELVVDEPINSTVSLPLDLTDYFRVAVPDNTLSMRLNFTGDTRQIQVNVTDASGKALGYIEDKAPGSNATTLTVTPLTDVSEIFVNVSDKAKYLAVLWDDSGSVSPYVAGLHRMLSNFAFDVDSRYEKVNLMSLYDKKPRFLLDTWAESPYQLLAAIRNYVGTKSSSAYINMEYALGQLNNEEGAKALLIMTDEQGDRGKYKDNKMEKMLNESDVSVFSFHATSSPGLNDIQANHMQSWADIGGGRYTYIRSKNEVPDAIAKVQAWLRKPAVYELQASAVNNTPGSLTVVSDQQDNDAPPIIALGAVEVILDASGSMWKTMADGQPRIVVAKEVLLELVSEKLPEQLPFALRVFGNRKAKSCRTDLELPLGPLSREKAIQKIEAINPQDRSKTPIGDSLAAVAKDLKKAVGKRVIILITDGEETCDADPGAVIADLKQQGFDVQVNIVGFAIDDDALKAQFAEWAAIGGGDYFDTNDAKQLIQSLQESLVPQFSVRDAQGDVVAQGRMNGPSVELLPGDYSVALSVEGYEPKAVTVSPGAAASVGF